MGSFLFRLQRTLDQTPRVGKARRVDQLVCLLFGRGEIPATSCRVCCAAVSVQSGGASGFLRVLPQPGSCRSEEAFPAMQPEMPPLNPGAPGYVQLHCIKSPSWPSGYYLPVLVPAVSVPLVQLGSTSPQSAAQLLHSCSRFSLSVIPSASGSFQLLLSWSVPIPQASSEP